MTAIVDYGVGNLFSLKSSFRFVGEEVTVTGNSDELERADRIVLPGVGAFGDAAEKLRGLGLDEVLIHLADSGKPLLGICLGMQLLFEKSLEFGVHRGLGLIPGEVRPIAEVIPENYKIPHIGWNALRFTEHTGNCPLFENIGEGSYVYFVHSYTDYGGILTAAVCRDKVYGCQFHPEKSGNVGLDILRAFIKCK